jgi:hypothetical protein
MDKTITPEQKLAEDLAGFRHDPLNAVLFAFPWGAGELTGSPGPRAWQAEALDYIGQHFRNPETRNQPCQIAISSGHDIGKTAFIAMVSWWGMSTFEDARINVSANTGAQLNTKTSPEIAKWFRLPINAHWFDKTVTSVKARDAHHAEEWRCDLVAWSEDNPAAFAGLHNFGKRLIFILDEASEIPQAIFDTLAGTTLDENSEILVLVCGNPTRGTGPFIDIVFGRQKHRWKRYVIDSRTVEGTNKSKLEQWAQDYGEDSDFFRVRARGLPPAAASAQFIDQKLIDEAQRRIAVPSSRDPLVAGVDFAWGGGDDNVIRFRRGYDARSIPPIKIKGEFTRDPAVLTGKLAEILTEDFDGEKLAMLFMDSAGIAAPVESNLRALGHENLMSVNFGAHSPDVKAAYMRDYMWMQMKEWLRKAAIDKDPDLAADLAADLAGPCLVSDKQQRVKLEAKELMVKRGLDSPDDADALALTFAFPVAPKDENEGREQMQQLPGGPQSWMSV